MTVSMRRFQSVMVVVVLSMLLVSINSHEQKQQHTAIRGGMTAQQHTAIREAMTASRELQRDRESISRDDRDSEEESKSEDNVITGNDRDKNGCIGSAGETYCESSG